MDPKETNEHAKKNIPEDHYRLTRKDHLGSSNAFEETENPLSRDDDNITDEKLDELLNDE